MNQRTNYATTALVLGIVALVLSFYGGTGIISIGCGIAGIIFSSKSKQMEGPNSMATAGLVLSIISLVLGTIGFLSCVACAGFLGCAGLASII